ncbi:MAG: hypothetical protein ACOCZD_01665, partial [Haloferacaceae archaeon]
SLQAVLVAYARRANYLDATVDTTVRRDVERLCRVARQQGYEVDDSQVLERTTPSTKAQALAAARRRVDVPPERRAECLAAFVRDARANGIDISAEDFRGTPGIDVLEQTGVDGCRHVLVDTTPRECVEPPVAETATESPARSSGPAEGVYTSPNTDAGSPVAVDGGAETASEHGDSGMAPEDADAETTSEGVDADIESTLSKTPVNWQITTHGVRQIEYTGDSEIGTSPDSENLLDPDTEVGDDESTFVWPAAEDDIDPAISPTIKTGTETQSEGLTAFGPNDASETTTTVSSDILEGIDSERPAVQIIERDSAAGDAPDPRALTASLAATGTSVTEALESI